MQVISETTRTNRKPHICNACRRLFGEGVKMRNQVVIYDGIGVFRTCPTCTELLEKYPNKFDDGCGVFDEGCVDEQCEVWEAPEELLAWLALGGS